MPWTDDWGRNMIEMSHAELIKLQAQREVMEEQFREAIEQEKERIRKHVPLLKRLFPWKIRIVRRIP